jgi:hypothetical protein
VPAQGIEKNVRAPRRALLAVPSVAEPRRAMSRRSVSAPQWRASTARSIGLGDFHRGSARRCVARNCFARTSRGVSFVFRHRLCAVRVVFCRLRGAKPSEVDWQLVAASPLGREGPVDCTCWRPAHWAGRGLSTAAGGGLGPNGDWSRGRLDPTCNDNGIASFDLVRHRRANGRIRGMVTPARRVRLSIWALSFARVSDPIRFVASSGAVPAVSPSV